LKALTASFSSGILFAIGLGISGMTRPIKVIGFLNFFGDWDPSLAFVMIGAIAVYFVANRMRRGMPSPLFGAKFAIPTRNRSRPAVHRRGCVVRRGMGSRRLLPGTRNRIARFRRGAGRDLRGLDGLGNVPALLCIASAAIGAANRRPGAYRR